MHGKCNLPFDECTLLAEAGTWGENEQINWTKLAERYGVQGAMKKRKIVRRAKLRLPGGEISYPTHKTVTAQKQFRKKLKIKKS